MPEGIRHPTSVRKSTGKRRFRAYYTPRLLRFLAVKFFGEFFRLLSFPGRRRSKRKSVPRLGAAPGREIDEYRIDSLAAVAQVRWHVQAAQLYPDSSGFSRRCVNHSGGPRRTA